MAELCVWVIDIVIKYPCVVKLTIKHCIYTNMWQCAAIMSRTRFPRSCVWVYFWISNLLHHNNDVLKWWRRKYHLDQFPRNFRFSTWLHTLYWSDSITKLLQICWKYFGIGGSQLLVNSIHCVRWFGPRYPAGSSHQKTLYSMDKDSWIWTSSVD